MVKIESIVKEALNGFLSLDLANKTAERIAEKAKEKNLVLIEERFCVWNDFEEKKPDVWIDDESRQYVEFAIHRKGPWKVILAYFDGTRFFSLGDKQKVYYADVTHWVRMPRLLG